MISIDSGGVASCSALTWGAIAGRRHLHADHGRYVYGIVRPTFPTGFRTSLRLRHARALSGAAGQGAAAMAAHAVRGHPQLADRPDCLAARAVRHAVAGSVDSAGRPARQRLPAPLRPARRPVDRRRRLQARALVLGPQPGGRGAGHRRVHIRHRAVLSAQHRHRHHLSQQGSGELHRLSHPLVLRQRAFLRGDDGPDDGADCRRLGAGPPRQVAASS